MSVVKALIGGLIGTCLGTGIYYYLDHSLGDSLWPWAALIVGLLAGLGVRIACGHQRSFMTGIVAMILSLASLLGLNFLTINQARQEAAALMKPAPASEEVRQHMKAVPLESRVDTEENDSDEADSRDDPEDVNPEDGDQAEVDPEDGDPEDGDQTDGDTGPDPDVDSDTAESDFADPESNAQKSNPNTVGPANDPPVEPDVDAVADGLPNIIVQESVGANPVSDAVAFAVTGLLAFVLGWGRGAPVAEAAGKPD